MKHEIAQATASTGVEKTPLAVGGGVSAVTLCGYSLPDIVSILTIIYLSFSICKLMWNWYKEWKADRAEKNCNCS